MSNKKPTIQELEKQVHDLISDKDPEKSKENNITALVYNSDFDDPFTILKRRNGKNFDKISFGTKFTLKA